MRAETALQRLEFCADAGFCATQSPPLKNLFQRMLPWARRRPVRRDAETGSFLAFRAKLAAFLEVLRRAC
jgi:hypothetical protein